MKNMPFIAIGNEELDNAPLLGDTIVCPQCGKTHNIQYGKKVLKDGTRVESNMLAFYKCGDKSFLAGIEGKVLCRDNK